MINDGLKPEVRNKIINLCKSIIPNAAILIYGSRARRDYSTNSDVDLALQANRNIGYFEI